MRCVCRFEGQTKTKLGNPETREFMRVSTEEELTEFFEMNPKILNDVVEKVGSALRAFPQP